MSPQLSRLPLRSQVALERQGTGLVRGEGELLLMESSKVLTARNVNQYKVRSTGRMSNTTRAKLCGQHTQLCELIYG